MDFGEQCINVADPSRRRCTRRTTPRATSMRPRSRATVTPELLRLIRLVRRRRGLGGVAETDSFELADIEDMFVEYAKSLSDSNLIQCDAVLADLFETDQFDLNDAFAKWAMLSRHFTSIDGQIHSRSQPELEVREIDVDSTDRAENNARRQLYDRWRRFEPNQKPPKSPWSYTSSETTSEKSSKRSKTDPENRCVICLDAPRTHAFLHANVIGDTGAHYCACAGCVAKVKWASSGCPVCRAQVIGVIKIHQE